MQGYANLNILDNNVAIKDGPNLDAFSRLRTSHPTALWAIQNQYDASPLVMEAGATGTGVAPAHQANSRMVKLRATAGTGESYYQSYSYIPYQAGKSQLIFVTGLLDAGVAATTVDVGYFDSTNGIFLRQNGVSGLQAIRRTSTGGSIVDNVVDQANWNIDKMDGTGVSGVDIDETKVFILVIDLQFLGMGRVRMGFDVGGQIHYFHQFLNANVIATPYMQYGSLPVAMILTATASAGAKDAYFKCASVSSEGGFADDIAYHFASPECTVTASDGARTHLMSIRPKTTFNSLTNRTVFRLDQIILLVTGNFPVFYELVIGQAISGTTTFNDINSTYCSFEYNNVGTISGSPAAVLESGYIPASNQSKDAINIQTGARVPISLDRSGAVRSLGTLSLIVTGVGGASACRGAICFGEIRT